MNAPFQLLRGHEKDIGGGFTVLRLLPAAQQRSVGPGVFFDHFGPTLRTGAPHRTSALPPTPTCSRAR